jgi:sarcosine oxidase gamma subunit
MKKKARNRYVICVRTEGAEDLEVRKVYRLLPDESASARGHLRVVDESGEDYLYPAEWFVAVEVPEEAEEALAAAASAKATRAR